MEEQRASKRTNAMYFGTMTHNNVMPFLNRLAGGKVTLTQLRSLKNVFSCYTLGEIEWNARGFKNHETKDLFFNNSDAIQITGNPILKMEAVKSCYVAKKQPFGNFNGLPNKIYLLIGAPVMLTANLDPTLGLCNSASGIVGEIFFDKENQG